MKKAEFEKLVTEKTSRIDDIITTMAAVKGERYAKAAACCADVVNAYKMAGVCDPRVVRVFTRPALTLGALAAGIDGTDVTQARAFSNDVMTFCEASFIELPSAPEPDSLGG